MQIAGEITRPIRGKRKQLLLNFPVSIFSSVMGLAGLSRALRLAVGLFNITSIYSQLTNLLAWSIFLVLLIFLLLKLIRYPQKLSAEFWAPAEGCFFATIPISILLLSPSLAPVSYLCCWIIGTSVMLGLAYLTIYNLLNIKQSVVNFTPGMILPAVGVLNIAVASGSLHPVWVMELNKFAFAIGLVLTVVFFTLIFARLMHHDKLTAKMEPTLMIMMSPFGVCFLAYSNITDQIDLFATVLFYFGLFFFTILFIRIFINQKSFTYTWWSVGFPTAALTNSACKYALNNHLLISAIIAAALLCILTGFIVYIFLKSLYLLLRMRLFAA
jgi:tellurite resistance protein